MASSHHLDPARGVLDSFGCDSSHAEASTSAGTRIGTLPQTGNAMEPFKEALACSLASLAIPPLLNWAEVTKSVQQTNVGSPLFASPKATITEIVKRGGGVGKGGVSRLALTGLDSSMAREVFYNASRWVLYSYVSKHIISEGDSDEFGKRFLAGFFCGVVGSLAANPFDLVRVRQQSMALDGMKAAPSVVREVRVWLTAGSA